MDELTKNAVDRGSERKKEEGTQRATLRDLHDKHVGKITDKWSLYIEELDRVLSVLRDQKIVILEIGVQNGGSLEIWSEYFPKAQKIVGIDIDPKCGELHFVDPRISVIVCDAASEDGKRKVLQHVSTFDLVIDDGSHKSSDIVRAFGCYFPLLNESGFYIVEDLHCSYMADYEGGLHNPLSAMAFFRRLTDITNYEHWRNHRSREYLLREFSAKYEVSFDNLDLAKIHSVGFINSLCVIEKAAPGRNVLGKRIVAGTEEFVTSGSKKVNQTLIHDMQVNIEDDTRLDVFEVINETNGLQEPISELLTAVQESGMQIASLRQALAERDGQIAAILSSKSWRITAPIRMVGVKLRLMRDRIAITKAIGGFARSNGLRAGWRLYKGRRLLLSSSAFDVGYYLRQNPDVAVARIDPALHYLLHGAREGRNPNTHFDTNWYLKQNPDVAKAGLNPLVHYIQFEARERCASSAHFSISAQQAANPDVAVAGLNKSTETDRAELGYDLKLTRNEKLLYGLNMAGVGLEVGASYSPIAPKKAGFRVEIIDHADAETLRKKYKEQSVDINNIEDVDYVWTGEPLNELTGKTDYYEWIIASHVIEHTPDLIGFLQQCELLLKPEGIISLAIPDHRYCFDIFRSTSTPGDVIQAHMARRIIHSPGTAWDHLSMAVRKGDQIAWEKGHLGNFSLIHSINEAKSMFKQAIDTDKYLDFHNWRFTPSSFRLILEDICVLGFLKNTIIHSVFPTTGCEFIVHLKKITENRESYFLDSVNRLRILQKCLVERREKR